MQHLQWKTPVIFSITFLLTGCGCGDFFDFLNSKKCCKEDCEITYADDVEGYRECVLECELASIPDG